METLYLGLGAVLCGLGFILMTMRPYEGQHKSRRASLILIAAGLVLMIVTAWEWAAPFSPTFSEPSHTSR